MKIRTTTETGRYGEDLAAKLLRKKGYKILEHNYRAGHNEVKTRSEHRVYGFEYGEPAQAVNLSKQRRTVQAAKAYLYKRDGNDEHDRMIRFDIIEVYLKDRLFAASPALLKIEHMEDAFRPR